MVGALGAIAIIFYAMIYSGIRELKGYRISTLDALLGRAETQILERIGEPGLPGAPTNTADAGGPCKTPGKLVNHAHPNGVVRLVPDAMRGFRDAERRAGRHIVLTGSYRTCAKQRADHASDPGRFADAGESAHPDGRAIDVANIGSNIATVRPHLLAAGWTQARAGDEPWHFSYGVTA